MSVNIPDKLPRNGMSIRELAKLAGASESFIVSRTSEPREVFLARADKKRTDVLRLRAKGLSMRAIAKELGVSVGTVHRYVHGA